MISRSTTVVKKPPDGLTMLDEFGNEPSTDTLRERRARIGKCLSDLRDQMVAIMKRGEKVPSDLQNRFNEANDEYDQFSLAIEVTAVGEREATNMITNLDVLRANPLTSEESEYYLALREKRKASFDGETRSGNRGQATGVEIWKDREGRDVPVISRGAKVAAVAKNGREFEGLTLGSFLRACVRGPKNEMERRALSEGTDSAGGFSTPSNLLPQVIDALRAQSVAFRAGARTIMLSSDSTTIVRLATSPTATWTAENASISDNTPTFEGVTFVPEKMISLIKSSRELIEDSLNIEDAMSTAFAGQFAATLDLAILNGTGSSNQPTGITVASNVNSVSMGTNGAEITSYDEIIDGIQLILEDGYNGDMTGIVMAPRTWGTIAKFADSTNQPLRKPPAIENIPSYQTSNMPIDETQGTSSDASTIIVGDFTQVLVGMRSGLQIDVLKERFADNDQFGFLARMRVDVVLAHPQAFAKIIGIVPA